MPLPTTDQPWPPAEFSDIAADIRLADVWWSGNANELADYYASPAAPRRARRGFWGRERSMDVVRVEKRIHLPAAAAIASASADLLFGETPSFAVGDGVTQERFDEIAESVGLGALLVEAGEMASGLGGVYLRPVVAPDVADHPILTGLDPDTVVPEFRWGRLVALTCWSEIDRTGTQVVRHLERYEAGLVTHGVFVGTATTLGERHDLRSFAATKALDDAQDWRQYGIVDTGCAFVPNIRPNRRHRRHPIGRWMGRADTAGMESVMSSLDETWSSLMRDIDLGKRRIIVPDEFLERRGRGQGATFDGDREVFSPLSIDPQSRDRTSIEVVDFAIRTSDHLEACRSLFAELVHGAGYSSSSVGDDSDGAVKTATEVDSQDSLSDRTTTKKRRYWTPALRSVLGSMLRLDRGVFRTPITPDVPVIEWPTLDQSSRTAETLNLLTMSQSASVQTRVRMLHPQWTDDQVAGEADAIKAEQGLDVQVADPTGGFA